MPVSGYIITTNNDFILLSPKSMVVKLTRIEPEESQKIQGDISKAMALLAPAISKSKTPCLPRIHLSSQ